MEDQAQRDEEEVEFGNPEDSEEVMEDYRELKFTVFSVSPFFVRAFGSTFLAKKLLVAEALLYCRLNQFLWQHSGHS